MVSVNYEKLVSRADLSFTKPVPRSEAGLPVGNGRMGSLVWTSPTALKFQINRVDVFAINGNSDSLIRGKEYRRAADDGTHILDYCGGCGFVDVDVGGQPFARPRQKLSIYNGVATIGGRDGEAGQVFAEILAWHEQDIMAVHIDDNRDKPLPIRIALKMLRPPMVSTANHTAISKLITHDKRIILTQEFAEDEYFCRSAVGIMVVGRDATAKVTNETTAQLTVSAAEGSLTVLIASAATFERSEDVVAGVLKQLDIAAGVGYAKIFEMNKAWWHSFWEKSFIHLHSQDGKAEELEKLHNYYLYVMNSSSRGKYPPKFNGMLWTTDGDRRKWGGQYWWWNTQEFYWAAMAANHIELTQPMFDMYSDMYNAQRLAAQQQWDSKGIFIAETCPFNGLAKLPDNIAKGLSDCLLGRKPFSETSAEFQAFVKTHRKIVSSRWSWVEYINSTAPHSWTTHIFSSGAKIAWFYWQRYEYTLDESWLRQRAYPIIKGVAEFYRNYPNLKKGKDGKYHIHGVNSHEPLWGAQDTMEELAAMRGILPLVIRASEILKVDSELRPHWKDLLDNLASFPLSNEPGAVNFHKHPSGRPTWAQGMKPCALICDDVSPTFVRPAVHFDLLTLETDAPEARQLANDTLESTPRYLSFLNGESSRGEHIIAAPMLGRVEDVKMILPAIAKGPLTRLPNRFTGDIDGQCQCVEDCGLVSAGLELALCQSNPAGPGQNPVIRVFPAWPKDWEASFKLLCRGGFLVCSCMQKGQIDFVEITSQLGGLCRIHNPWPHTAVELYRDGRKTEQVSGPLLKFDTGKSENIVIVRTGAKPKKSWSIIQG